MTLQQKQCEIIKTITKTTLLILLYIVKNNTPNSQIDMSG